MEQIEFFEIPSPCIGVCTANSKGYCKGCLRSRDERLYWQRLTNEQKNLVLRRCALRKKKLLKQILARHQTQLPTSEDQLNLFDGLG